jgi:hypothetical protein
MIIMTSPSPPCANMKWSKGTDTTAKAKPISETINPDTWKYDTFSLSCRVSLNTVANHAQLSSNIISCSGLCCYRGEGGGRVGGDTPWKHPVCKIIDLSANCFRSQQRTIPFNVHTPLWTSSIKFQPLRKKSKCRHKHPPPEIKKFLPYPSEKTQRSKDADAHNPSEMAFSNPLRNSRP